MSSNSPSRSRHARSSAAASHGHDSHPQSYNDSAGGPSSEPHHVEYDGLIGDTRRRKNCCTWKVAAVFLTLVAGALVVTWAMLPAEEIVARYIPTFDAPANPYAGPEAGTGGSSGGGGGAGGSEDGQGSGGNGGISIGGGMPPSQTPAADDADAAPGTAVPSFMQCPDDGAPCCNGSPSNCKLRVDEMLFGLVHNAMSSEEGGFIVGYNHRYGLERALVAGYRGLSLDVCNCDGVLQFCHNVCDLGERMPNEVFTNTLQFLNDYPSEVVVLLFEASQEKGPIVWNDLYEEMANVDGFTDMIYEHTYGEAWPRMGDLVERNKRIIVFYFNGGTCDEDGGGGGGGCPPGFEYFYNHAAETQFQSASVEELEDVAYSCEITRGPRDDAAVPAAFFVVNNFVTPPDAEASRMANSKAFLSDRLTNCANQNKRRPNFVYLDFWSEGVTAQLVQYANEQYSARIER